MIANQRESIYNPSRGQPTGSVKVGFSRIRMDKLKNDSPLRRPPSKSVLSFDKLQIDSLTPSATHFGSYSKAVTNDRTPGIQPKSITDKPFAEKSHPSERGSERSKTVGLSSSSEAPTSKGFPNDQHQATAQLASPFHKLERQSTLSRAATNGNWRKKDERPQMAPAHYGLDISRATEMTRHSCSVGKIVRAPVHKQACNDALGIVPSQDDINTSLSRFGFIYSKVRWMIVVAVHAYHYTALPIYTHNGTGLSNKSESARLEYASVRDLRHKGPFEKLSDNRALAAEMDAGTVLLDRKSVVHLTHPLTREYGLCVEEQGHLDRISADHIVLAWQKASLGI